jgi:hypothetical protein
MRIRPAPKLLDAGIASSSPDAIDSIAKSQRRGFRKFSARRPIAA